jgi:hypothetical protein
VVVRVQEVAAAQVVVAPSGRSWPGS